MLLPYNVNMVMSKEFYNETSLETKRCTSVVCHNSNLKVHSQAAVSYNQINCLILLFKLPCLCARSRFTCANLNIFT